MAGIEGAGGTTPAAPGPDDMDDIAFAYGTLIAAGFTSGEALGCVEALSEAGLMIARPATLLNRMVDAAVELGR